MKKIILVLFIIVITAVTINEKDNLLIPKDAIRLRIIANSNSLNDQKLKLDIKNDVEKALYDVVKDATSIKEARNLVSNNLGKVNNILKEYNVEYNIDYGQNYFPKKEFKGVTYEEGNYESLVVTIGEGLGKNWWCVLFPPLCLIEESDTLNEAEYELYVKKIINNISLT